MVSVSRESEEIGVRWLGIYENKLRALLEPAHHGEFVAIDVDGED